MCDAAGHGLDPGCIWSEGQSLSISVECWELGFASTKCQTQQAPCVRVCAWMSGDRTPCIHQVSDTTGRLRPHVRLDVRRKDSLHPPSVQHNRQVASGRALGCQEKRLLGLLMRGLCSRKKRVVYSSSIVGSCYCRNRTPYAGCSNETCVEG